MRISIPIILLLFPFFLTAQILNGDFSEWEEPLNTSSHEGELIQIGVVNPQRGTPEYWQSSDFGVCRIGEGCESGYGAILYSWYHGDPAFLSQKIAVSENPQKLTGCYKSILYDIQDTALIRYVKITVEKNNEIIGSALWSFESTDEYQNFEVPIEYTSSAIADSITVEFHSDVKGSIEYPMDGIVFLDEIQLDFSTSNASAPIPDNINFQIYPNPLQNSLFIDCNQKGDYAFEIFDLKGQLVKKGNLPALSNQLDIGHFSDGLYIFNISDANNQQLVGKFLKICGH